MSTGPAGPRIAAVVPCYRVRGQVLGVLAAMPAEVAYVYCVDDACPDGSGDLIAAECTDPRVRVLRHAANQGVGGATLTGYRAALADGADIVVKIDGDGQMDPGLLPHFVAPIAAGEADYTKGNRFYSPANLTGMPPVRLLGNAALSFLSKFSTGYWDVFDPNNGYTAIHAAVAASLPLDRIARGYFFEADLLFRLSTVRAVVVDVPIRAVYRDERSSLKVRRVLLPMLGGHLRNFAKRLFYSYLLRDFHVASIEWLLGPALLLFGLVFGLRAWVHGALAGQYASAGTVMLSALPILLGVQMLLSAINFDVQNVPRRPVHRALDRRQGRNGRP